MISITAPSKSSPKHAPPRLSRPPWLLGLAIVSILGGLYLGHFLYRGWVPHDEGTLGQSAERVLLGQLPHRDFDEVYTGGLSYVNAAAMRLGGIRLSSIRRPLFWFSLIWLMVVYYLASRWASIPVAVLVTLLAVTASIPNYPAAMPSWYNLFLATLGVASLVRFLETDNRVWIFVAGFCGGLSILVKIVGLYYVAAMGLTLLACEQSGFVGSGAPGRGARKESAPGRWPRLDSAIVILGLLALVAGIFWVYGRHAPQRSIGALVVPAAVPAILLIERELRLDSGPLNRRIRDLWRLALPFTAGLLLILVPFLVHYTINGALGDLLKGLFVDPARRLRFAEIDFPSLATLWAAIPPFALLAWSRRWNLSTRYQAAAVLIAPLAVLLFRSNQIAIYQPLFYSIRWAVLIAVVVGALRLRKYWAESPPQSSDAHSAVALFTLLAVAGLCSLVQFPFSAPIYFFYVAPLGILAVVALMRFRSPGPRPLFVLLVCFYMVFCAVWVNRGFIYWMGIRFVPNNQELVLNLDRGGILVNSEDKGIYESLVALIRENARGPFIYATPDCPQVYFLSGYQNPTATFFDFFDSPDDRSSRILQTLEEKRVNLVVLNGMPQFSNPPSDELLSELRSNYPHSATIDHFEVRWKS